MKRILYRFLSLAYPPCCVVCARATAWHHSLCPLCWSSIDFITKPYCPTTGSPLPYEMHSRAPYGQNERYGASSDPEIRAVALYGETVKQMIYAFKYNDRQDLAPFIANLMANVHSDFQAHDQILVPVPLHSQRLRHRKFNHATLLAKYIGRKKGLNIFTSLVQRVRNTKPQSTLSFTKRKQNMVGAFSLTNNGCRVIRNRNIVIVDDIVTTGATFKALREVLMDSGALDVRLLCFAKVNKND